MCCACREAKVKHLILSGLGDQIYKFLRNLHELNVRLAALLLPWDGQLDQLIGADLANLSLVALQPEHSVMAEFHEAAEEGEHDEPLSWQLVKVFRK